MTFDITGLLDLWQHPWRPGADAEAAFRRYYTDPVTINGTPASVTALVDRSIALNAALIDQRREVHQVVESGDAVAVAFGLSGRHVGPLATRAGILAPTGAVLDLQIMDILTLTDGRISSIRMVADELGGLSAIGAVSLISSAQEAG